jgi:hypothetical protein
MADGVENPADPRRSFSSSSTDLGDEFASRITFLLLLGVLYGNSANADAIIQELSKHQHEFPMPPISPGARLETRVRVRDFQKQYDIDPRTIRRLFDPENAGVTERRRSAASTLVDRLYEGAGPQTAGDILLLGLGDPNEFTRVAAAASFFDLFDDMSLAARALISVIDDGLDDFARQLAEIVLRKLGGDISSVSTSKPSDSLRLPPIAPRTAQINSAILVHGSHFGFVGTPIGDWWKPNGDFHTYIKSNFRPNLYSRPDFYTWSGGWSDHARSLAAKELVSWTQNRNLSKIDLVAHSHGGNVAMRATHLGLELDSLILLSCPAHVASYLPDFSRVRSVVSYHIKLDWVVLVDRGSTYFDHPNITNHTLPRWFFRHTDTRSPITWRKFGISI